ncbi:hypothetical protein QCA50_010168 [Cerrena zonata]|uniref:Uncharacterized protein n=1 Tax=Cerrena zonata TaxID=2478898 RepID=A0AAW0G9D1_9APHY
MRRSSSPHSLNGVNTPDAEDQSNKQHLNPVPVRAALSNRSLSSSSQGASEPSSSSVDDSSTSAPSESLLAAFRSRSPSISLPKKDNGVSTGSNFFQTLKSRDKQAISNTAKEAMRKWGVNWGGLKKDSMPTVNPSDQDTSPDP